MHYTRSDRNAEGTHRKQDDKAPKQTVATWYKRHCRFSPFNQHPSFLENQQPLASDPNFRSNNTGLNKALCVHRGTAAGDMHSRNISLSAAGYIRACTNSSSMQRRTRGLSRCAALLCGAPGSHYRVRIQI